VALCAGSVSHLEDVIVYALQALGYGPFFSQQLVISEHSEPIPARIAAEHRGAYEVWSSVGAGRAKLAGRLRHELAGAELPGVGDWVLLAHPPGPEQDAVIDRVLERRTAFVRGAAGREARAQVVAANVDLVFVVCGLDGDFSARRIERYLARIAASGADAAIILNKADLNPDPEASVAEVRAHCAGVPIHVTSALHSEGIEAVRAHLHEGTTIAIVGSSGAGKSTLVNALLGEDRMRTGAVRASDDRGQHVTTHRQLVLVSGGGLLIDTPGMRELELLDAEGLDAVFGDIAALAAHCRYRDCRHEAEPGCAVTRAVEAGELDAARLEHHQKLEREGRAYELRHDERRRRQAERAFGKLKNEVVRAGKRKEGKR
jgi:ribosome biogenesis GTPase